MVASKDFMRNAGWAHNEGILLQAIPYLEKRRILKVFTKDAGMISVIANLKNASFAIPFCRAEWTWRPTSGDLFSLKEISLIDPFQHLREDFSSLRAAGSIASDLLRSQHGSKPSANLYELLLASLSHLKKNPEAIAQSFRLKLLQCEGLVHLQDSCMRCSAPSSALADGESVCANHLSFRARSFFPEEWRCLLILGLARRFSEFDSLALPTSFVKKMSDLFLERIR